MQKKKAKRGPRGPYKKSAPQKRKYTKRAALAVQGNGDPKAVDPKFEVDGMELLVIQKGMPSPFRTRYIGDSHEYRKLIELLRQIKVGESIAIRKAWKGWVPRIIKDEQLPIKMVTSIISKESPFMRTYRMK